MKKHLTYLFLSVNMFSFAQSFKLPKLKYKYGALMEMHYGQHHQAYVTNLNKAIIDNKLENISLEDLLLTAGTRPNVIRENAGGHYNHSLFWEILTPTPNTQPSASFFKAIEANFGTLDSLKKLVFTESLSIFGSGWTWLVVTPDHKLKVCSTANQDNPLMDVSAVKGIPILGIDVWEHAYYYKYQNKRNDYLTSILNLIDWETVSKKFEKAQVDPLLSKLEKK